MSPFALGESPLSPSAWSLGGYEALVFGGEGNGIEATVELPEGGQVLIFGSTQPGAPGAGAAIVLRAGEAPDGRQISEEIGEQPLQCEGSLPSVEAEARYSIAVEASGGALSATAGGQTLRCQAPTSSGAPAIQAGLRRVQVGALVATASGGGRTEAPPPAPGWWAPVGAVAGAAGGLALFLLEAALGIGAIASVATGAPLLLAGLTAGSDLGSWVEWSRLPDLPARWLPVLVGLVPALLLKAGLHLGRLGRSAPAGLVGWGIAAALAAPLLIVLGALGLGVVAALAAAGVATSRLMTGEGGAPAGAAGCLLGAASLGALAASGAVEPWARIYFTLAGAAAGGILLLNVNSDRLRFHNVLSLILAIAGIAALEYGARFTSARVTWADGPGDAAQSSLSPGGVAGRQWHEEFDALRDGQATDYPDWGYPVAFGPKRAPLRIVCLGGSSTGGAFQNDDLGQFYPARLERALGDDVEVINQGVGNWNSFHIARYVEDRGAALEADVWTVYAGYNDQVLTPAPYRDLYALWSRGEVSTASSGGPLRGALLYRGLRSFVRGAAGLGQLAVPLPHARENLEAIADAAARDGAKLLLLSEAVRPDPALLDPYWGEMDRLAEARADVRFSHVGVAMVRSGVGMFLDQNHLSDRGHRRLATLIAEELRAAGWLEAE